MTEHTGEAALAHNASPALRLGAGRLRRQSDEWVLAHQRFIRPEQAH
ncbi:hypothetical protein ACNFR7_29355 [Streptomyces sp. RM1]